MEWEIKVDFLKPRILKLNVTSSQLSGDLLVSLKIVNNLVLSE